jgi:hypothetical protein
MRNSSGQAGQILSTGRGWFFDEARWNESEYDVHVQRDALIELATAHGVELSRREVAAQIKEHER